MRLPIPALDEHIGLQGSNELYRVVFAEPGHEIHALQRRHHTKPICQRVDRPRGPFKALDRCIGIERNDQVRALGSRLFQILDMSRMQEIEASISKYNLCGLATAPDLGEMALESLGRSDLGEEFARGGFQSCTVSRG